MYMGSYNPEFPSTLSGLTGWYTGDSFQSSPVYQWTDLSGNNRHVTVNGSNGTNITGTISKDPGNTGFVAHDYRPFIYGDTNAKMRFPTTVMTATYNNYTFFHVSRYYVPGMNNPQTTYAYDDQLYNTPFTGSLTGNANNGPATRVTSTSPNVGYIEMCHSGTSRQGHVSWQLTMGDSWEVDAEIYINPINYGGADDIRFIFYATNPITTSDAPTGTGGHGGHYIRWEYYNSDTIEIYNSANTRLTTVATTLNMNQWMPIKITYVNGNFTATIRNSSGTVLSNGTRTYNFGTTFSSYHNTAKYFGFSGRSGGVQARDRVRNIYFRSLPPTPTRSRIWDGVGNNWLSGFHSQEAGVAYHGGWATTNTSVDVHGNDWVFSTDQRYLYRSNGVTRGSGIGGGTSAQLSVNWGVYESSQPSDWAIAEVIVYNRTLSSTEYTNVEDYLNKKYTAAINFQSIGTDVGDTAPYGLNEYYNEPFTDGTFTPSSGTISAFDFIGDFIGEPNPRVLGVPVSGGQQEYTSPGTYTFTAPTGVTSVCVVCIGGGGGGMYYSYSRAGLTYAMNGGSGGGLGWKNNIPVVPGNTYTAVVGAGGSQGAYSSGSSNGGSSYFISSSTVAGNGGGYGRYAQSRVGGTYVGDGGGNGGGVVHQNSSGYGPCGGGGAGGYSGNGGSTTNRTSYAGSGGGGGGGYVGSNYTSNGGGGVGIYGEGSSGALNGGGGSGGVSATSRAGGTFGGGGGGSSTRYYGYGGNGGGGAVRIIWGTGRAYPATNTADV